MQCSHFVGCPLNWSICFFMTRPRQCYSAGISQKWCWFFSHCLLLMKDIGYRICGCIMWLGCLPWASPFVVDKSMYMRNMEGVDSCITGRMALSSDLGTSFSFTKSWKAKVFLIFYLSYDIKVNSINLWTELSALYVGF